MPTPALLPLKAARNSFSQFDLILSDKLTGVALNLSNCYAIMQIRAAPGAPGNPLLSVNSSTPTTNGSVITFTAPLLGKIRILVKQLDYVPFPSCGAGGLILAYDLLVQPLGFDPAQYVYGPFNFSNGVTRT